MKQLPAADIFRQKLEEAREAVRAEAFPMVFAGFPCRVRALPRIHFINAGRMPEHLTRRLLGVLAASGQGTSAELSASEIVEGEVFMRKAVCAVLVEPQVVESGLVPEGGYLYADLLETAPAFVSAVFQWIMRDCPMPAEEKGEGVLGVEDLERFPDGAERQPSVDAGDKREGGGTKAVGAASTSRKRTSRK
jgi:hypothetical protein